MKISGYVFEPEFHTTPQVNFLRKHYALRCIMKKRTQTGENTLLVKCLHKHEELGTDCAAPTPRLRNRPAWVCQTAWLTISLHTQQRLCHKIIKKRAIWRRQHMSTPVCTCMHTGAPECTHTDTHTCTNTTHTIIHAAFKHICTHTIHTSTKIVF